MQTVLQNEEDTERLAAILAHEAKSGDILLLHGPLGSGKSVFARAFIRALAGEPRLEVPSPTFTLVQTYDTPAGPLWHFDFYRLKRAEEIYELGWEEALAEGIILAEWPERLGNLLPPARLDIILSATQDDPHARTIQVKRIGA